MHTRFIVLSIALLLAPCPRLAAQSTARDSVATFVQRVFDAMRQRDTTTLREAFDSTARLMSVPDDQSRSTRPHTVSRFLTGIAATHPDSTFDERMYDPQIRVEGPIAQLWTYYTFRNGRTFSHCGMDAISLARMRGAWRIVSWTWTIRRTGCTHAD